MLTHHRHRGFRTVAVLLTALVILAACGSDDDDEGAEASGSEESTETTDGGEVVPVDAPGVTDTEIRFAAFGTNSNNPLGTCVLDCFVDGINAYFAYRNSEGGVHGRELVVSDVLDDELGKNKERALEIIAADNVFGAFSATQIASGWADMSEANIPLYTWSIHPEGQKENIFGYSGATCYDCTTRTIPYLSTVLGAKKVASLGYGISQNSKLCSQGIEKSLELYSDATGGAKVVYLNDDLPFGLPNGVGPEVSAMKEAGVDFVTACIDLNGMKTIAQELGRQGMGDVPMYHPNTYDQAFVDEAGDLFEGDIVIVQFRPFEAEAGDSALDDFTKWMEETGSELTEISMYGWVNAHLAYEGLLAAGPEFDRQKVIDATNQIEDFSAGGLINPIDWTRQHEPPTQDDPTTHGYEFECSVFVQINDGAFEVLGDRAKPWNCWSNKSREWAEPEPTNFE